jgi:CyaY protein
MNESEFNERVDDVFYTLEMRLDDIDSDMDYEAGGGVLTLQFENGSTMVFSRQSPTCQLWLATRAGGFHYEYDPEQGDWRNTRDQSYFRPFVVAQMKEQGGVDFSWD